MKSTFLIILFAFFSFGISAQEVQWSDEYESKVAYPSYFAINGNSFYELSFTIPGLYRIEYYENAVQKSSTKVKDFPSRCITLNDELILFFVVDKGDRLQIFYERYNTDCEIVGEKELLIDYQKSKKVEMGQLLSHYVKILQSPNRKYICVEYPTWTNPDAGNTFDYVIYDQSFKKISNGSFDSGSSSRSGVDVVNEILSDKGTLYFGVLRYAKDGNKYDRSILESYSVQINNGGQTLDVDLLQISPTLRNKKFISVQLGVEADTLVLTGLFKEDGRIGFCLLQLDQNIGKLLKERIGYFEEGFTDLNLSANQSDPGLNSRDLYRFDLRDTRSCSDGGRLIVFEKTFASNYDYYYYHDVLICKISNDGSISWIQTVKKDQTLYDKREAGASIVGFIHDDLYTILFNDNHEDYDTEGKYINENKSPSRWSNKNSKQVIGKVEIHLKDGLMERSALPVSEELIIGYQLLAVKSRVNYSKGELLLFVRNGAKEKVGLLKL